MLWETWALAETLKNSAALEHLLDKVKAIFVFVHFMNSLNVGVIKFFQNVDFLEKVTALSKYLKFFFWYNFDCPDYLLGQMNGFSGAGSSGVSDVLVELKVVFDVLFVVKVMFFRRPGNFWFGDFSKLPSRFQNRFEILA